MSSLFFFFIYLVFSNFCYYLMRKIGRYAALIVLVNHCSRQLGEMLILESDNFDFDISINRRLVAVWFIKTTSAAQRLIFHFLM